MTLHRSDEILLWNEETGVVIVLSLDQRIAMVMAGTIVWCEHHQCFHYVTCPPGSNETRH